MTTSFNYPLDDIDQVQIALLGGSPRQISLGIESILRIAKKGIFPELIEELEYTHQTGLLHSLINEYKLQDFIPSESIIDLHFRAAIHENISEILLQYACTISKLFENAGINHAFLKGAVSSPLLYKQRQERQFKDLDVLVSSENAIFAFALLMKLGFIPGVLNLEKNTIDIIHVDINDIRLDGYELPTLWLEVPIIENTEIDQSILLNKILQTKSKGFSHLGNETYIRIPVEIHFDLIEGKHVEWKSTVYPLDTNNLIYGLDIDLHFVHSLYKGYLDVRIFGKRHGAKLFSDCWRLIHSHPNFNLKNAIDLTTNLDLSPPLIYLLHHGHSTFDIELEPSFLEQLTKQDKYWAKSAFELGDFMPSIFRNRVLLRSI